MANKVKAEEAAAAATAKESQTFCVKRGSDLDYTIGIAKTDKETFQSKIEKAGVKVEELAGSMEQSLSNSERDQADLDAANEVRDKEAKTFQTEEKELTDTIATLEKAIMVLNREKSGKSESLLQVQQAPNVLQAVDAMVSASMISAQDAKGLSALLQRTESEDEDEQQPAAGPAYEKKTGGVMELIENLFDKAKQQLASLRKKETVAIQNYQMLSQSLNDAVKFAKREIERAQAEQSNQQKEKADAEKSLKHTSANLAKDSKEFKDLKMDCKRKAEDYAVEKKDREEEIKAVETAKDALQSKAMGASNQKYGLVQKPSFLQLGQKSAIRNSADLANVEVVHMIRQLAHDQHSKQIAFLAQKIGAAIRNDHSAKGPFNKIIKMIGDMVANMEKTLREDSDKKAYCDSERAKVDEKKNDKQNEVDKLKSRMDSIASDSAQLKTEVQDLQSSLTELVATMGEMSKMRSDEKAAFDKNSGEMAAGLEGVKIALKVLRDYYKGKGGATGIIGMLEVCESDFAKSLSDMKKGEKTASDDFKKESNEMKQEKIRQEQDIKYKTEAAERLDKDLADVQSDSDSVAEEMAAIIDYSNGIEGECSETKESFAEKVAKRQAEIDGLKQALDTLKEENGFAFVQGKSLRGKA
eukprot:TRINITY_DN25489_c0_g1_i1.p1 TRINITY_DN25489_c0_g1~~TRINITY_DN25489_c0_g1_i1.p1  ORF type:complete len:706 (-),score=216.34 TRINITY_DN25489_c0_g1_i1:148-2070(-)